MFGFRNVVLPLLLAGCAGFVAAQSASENYRQTGKLAGAHASMSGPTYYGAVYLEPVVGDSGTDLYTIEWWMVSFSAPPDPPQPPPQVFVGARGKVEASYVKDVGNTIALDLDIANLKDLFVQGMDCRNGICLPFTPTSFALKGTFTRTRGPYGYSYSRNGSDDYNWADPVCKSSQSFSGTRNGGSATFTGSMGSTTVTPPEYGHNAEMYTQRGQLRYSWECAPVPPPPPPPPPPGD